MDFINFNEHITQNRLNVYGGSEKKRTVILDDGKQYLLKFPDPTREVNREISYINNAVSEYIGCHIFKQLGFEVQETILGTFTDERGKEKVACACRDIRENGDVLHEAENLNLEFLDDTNDLTFHSVHELLYSLYDLDSDMAFREYCNRFIVDAFLGNTDRHNGNWGIIENGNNLKMAPVYDCGSSLSPLLSDDEFSERLAVNEAMNAKSVIQDENGRRIHYRDYLMSGVNADVNRALAEIVPKINIEQIHKIIDDIPYIKAERKDFYKHLLDVRYERVLIPALENVLGIEKSDEYQQWNSKTINAIYDKFIKQFTKLPDSGKVCFEKEDKSYVEFNYNKNNDFVFFSKEDGICEGMAALSKSNRNVCKFVQSARQMRLAIDINDIRIKAEKTSLGKD